MILSQGRNGLVVGGISANGASVFCDRLTSDALVTQVPRVFYEILYWGFSCRILRTLKKVSGIYLTKIVRPSPISTLKIQIHVHHFTITFLGLLSHQRSREFPQRKIGPSAFSRNPPFVRDSFAGRPILFTHLLFI